MREELHVCLSESPLSQGFILAALGLEVAAREEIEHMSQTGSAP